MKSKFLQNIPAFLVFILLLSFSVLGQETPKSSALKRPQNDFKNEIVTLQLQSNLMKREMPYRVIIPNRYNIEKEKRYAVIYLLHGLTGHFDNWTDKTKLDEYSTQYQFIIVMPEGNDGWYSDSETVPNDKYESYFIQELIPEIDKKFRTLSDRNHRTIAGLSMGGYGSLKFGLKYPEKFVLAGSFSGALRAAEFTEKQLGNGWKALTDSIIGVYGKEDSETRKQNNLFQLLQAKSIDDVKKLPFFYIDCGTEDGLLQANKDFANLLLEKKAPHQFRQLPGKHEWKFWDSQVQEFLRLSERFINN